MSPKERVNNIFSVTVSDRKKVPEAKPKKKVKQLPTVNTVRFKNILTLFRVQSSNFCALMVLITICINLLHLSKLCLVGSF